MASLKSAVTWARLHVASDERGKSEREKEGNTLRLCAPSFAALVILIFSLFLFSSNILHHLTFRLAHETETKGEALFDAACACAPVCACVCMLW